MAPRATKTPAASQNLPLKETRSSSMLLILLQQPEEFQVAFGALYRRVDQAFLFRFGQGRLQEGAHGLHGFLPELFGLDDAALQIARRQLELRLYERYHFPAGRHYAEDRAEDQPQRNKRDVYGAEPRLFREQFRLEETGIGLRHEDHPRVVKYFFVYLPHAHVHRVDLERPLLEEAVGEAACGHAHVEAGPVFDRYLKSVKRAFQLGPAARDIGAVAFRQLDQVAFPALLPGLLRRAPVDGHQPGHDGAQRLLAAFKKPVRDASQVQPCFHPDMLLKIKRDPPIKSPFSVAAGI